MSITVNEVNQSLCHCFFNKIKKWLIELIQYFQKKKKGELHIDKVFLKITMEKQVMVFDKPSWLHNLQLTRWLQTKRTRTKKWSFFPFCRKPVMVGDKVKDYIDQRKCVFSSNPPCRYTMPLVQSKHEQTYRQSICCLKQIRSPNCLQCRHSAIQSLHDPTITTEVRSA